MQNKSPKKRIFALVVLVAVFMTSLSFSKAGVSDVYAVNKKLTLSRAKSLALTNSMAVEKTESQISSKQAAYKQKVKAIALKKKKLSSFSWSPLFSFTFPDPAKFDDEAAFAFEPVQIQGQIDNATHKLIEDEIKEYNKVQGYFVKIVSDQKKISFNKTRAELLEQTIAKNKARLLAGEAKESDIKSMEASLKKINNNIISDERDLEAIKKKLSTAINLDVTTGYDFENPFVSSELSREMLPSFIQYTLDHNQSYYEACTDETTAMVELQTDYNLIQNHYKSSDVNIIRSYVVSVLNGQKISSARAFKKSYDEFLNKIDSYWQGKKRILFFKIPKVWFKGETDGVNYIEEEPYAMYEAAMGCQEARITREEMKAELTQQVEDTYNTYVSMRNAYLNLEDQVAAAQKQLESDSVLNRLGELSYEEYKSSQDSFEGLENDMLQALADYSQTLYDFDYLTCGAVSQYLAGGDTNMFLVGNGVSYIEEDLANGAYYYLTSIVQNQEFVLTVSIPDDFSVSVSDYELYVNGTQVGERTSVDESIRHLSLIFNDGSTAKIKFFDGDKAVCDCDIDPTAYSGELKIVKGINVRKGQDADLGTYTAEHTEVGTVKLKLDLGKTSDVAYFRLKYKDKYIGGESLNDITKPFIYLSLMTDSMNDIDIEFFDKDGNQLFTGYFDSTGGKVKKNES